MTRFRKWWRLRHTETWQQFFPVGPGEEVLQWVGPRWSTRLVWRRTR